MTIKKKCFIPNNTDDCKTVDMCCQFCDNKKCMVRCKHQHKDCKYANNDVFYNDTAEQISLW